MGHIEEQIFDQYTRHLTRRTSDVQEQYIDGIAGAFSDSTEEIEDFATCTFVKGFHPSLKVNWSISDEQLPFLDLVLKPTTTDRLLYTSVHYHPTGTHTIIKHHCTRSYS